LASDPATDAMARAGPAAVCEGVVKIYWTASGEVHALRGVDAEFPAGALTAVVGPSGSGKSSLLRILIGLDAPTAGSVTVDGRELKGLRTGTLRRMRRRAVGYVFQRPSDNLIPYLTVRGHIRMAARVRSPVKRLRPAKLLDELELTRHLDKLPHQLSGGEQQRLAFAQAVVGTPSLVVADEPTAELDSTTGARLLQVMRHLASMGVALVVATHDAAAVAVAEKAVYLRHGTVEAETQEGQIVSVIDGSGRIQLPPQALKLFPRGRAVIRIGHRGVEINPP
jgi:putative ABC transport system ATP-binding protein